MFNSSITNLKYSLIGVKDNLLENITSESTLINTNNPENLESIEDSRDEPIDQNQQNYQYNNEELCAVEIPGLTKQKRFFIIDQNSKTRFLIDSGAECSVLPRSHLPRRFIPQHRKMSNNWRMVYEFLLLSEELLEFYRMNNFLTEYSEFIDERYEMNPFYVLFQRNLLQLNPILNVNRNGCLFVKDYISDMEFLVN
ncbi:Protein of unknown function [Cotesia congregata]|uniref:Peptidase A2 domain-containing protein n=1 Tax=Cotesia congregata TaxID=51543 RepID=A0A8J2HQF4_COTCN|nr:Protein of unknown function [Cotesia congregata]